MIDKKKLKNFANNGVIQVSKGKMIKKTSIFSKYTLTKMLSLIDEDVMTSVKVSFDLR